MSRSVLSSSSVNSAWVRAFFQPVRGLSVMKTSVSSTPIGSVAISAVPMRLQTCSTSSGNVCQDRLFDLGVVADRLVQVGAGQAHDADGDRPFRQPRHELGTQVRRDHAEGHDQHAGGEADHCRLVVHGEPQDRVMDRVGDPHQPRLALGRPLAAARGSPAPASASAREPSSRPGRKSPSGPSAGTSCLRPLPA